MRADIGNLQATMMESIMSVNETLRLQSKADRDHDVRIVFWQQEVIDHVHKLDEAAQRNHKIVVELQTPITNDIIDLKAETHMFFKELFRVQAKFDDFAYQIDKAVNIDTSQSRKSLPYSHRMPRS